MVTLTTEMESSKEIIGDFKTPDSSLVDLDEVLKIDDNLSKSNLSLPYELFTISEVLKVGISSQLYTITGGIGKILQVELNLVYHCIESLKIILLIHYKESLLFVCYC